jgi:hypothetical protein
MSSSSWWPSYLGWSRPPWKTFGFRSFSVFRISDKRLRTCASFIVRPRMFSRPSDGCVIVTWRQDFLIRLGKGGLRSSTKTVYMYHMFKQSVDLHVAFMGLQWLPVQRDCFLEQHYPVDLCNGKVLCSLSGTDWILKYIYTILSFRGLNWME